MQKICGSKPLTVDLQLDPNIKKLSSFENQMNSETFESDFGKKERLTISREKAKLEKVLGGISSGQNIIASFAVKPTSSILTSRETIDKKGKNTKISVRGRHDPCVGIRAVPIGEAMISCVILDHLLMHRAQCG